MTINIHKLQQIVCAHRILENSEVSYEDAYAQLEAHNLAASWLRAESRYHDSIKQWLLAETRWEFTQKLINGDPTYQAAERGWKAMREVCLNLDGTDSFVQLSPILRDRYAVFAAAVLNEPTGNQAAYAELGG